MSKRHLLGVIFSLPLLLGPGLLCAETAPENETATTRIKWTQKGLELPGHLRINGMFDLAYDRTGFSGNPREGRNAIRNFHRFLFLSRQDARDPFFFTTELIDLTFYEAGARFRFSEKHLSLMLRGGKLLVPFGPEPNFHHSYGGLVGFDQQLLPVVWSRHGLSGQWQWSFGGVRLRGETYAIHGYDLPNSDAVLNLQGDFSSFDDARFAFGERVAMSWRSATLWYSLLVNPLGYDRLLMVQAVDLSLWSLAPVPVLKDFALGAGLMRADASGGGPGLDYYHFGSYVELTYRALDWLSVRGRSGLRTTDNRRGAFADKDRYSNQDSVSHNVSLLAEHKGWHAELTWFWNFEKADEIENDTIRLRAGYAF